MGSGKTTLGKILATHLNLAFIDLDTYIEQRYFKTITQLFEEKGEDEFRIIEQAALQEVSDFENIIISTGGGAPCFFNNMQLMNEKGITIFLNVTAEKLVENLKNAKSVRPLLKDKTDDELLSFIQENLTKRAPFYSQAKLVLNPENSIEKLVAQISAFK
jgi:shikimate kinase